MNTCILCCKPMFEGGLPIEQSTRICDSTACSLCSRLEKLDVEISDIRENLERAVRERDFLLKTEGNAFHNPLNTLPSEIISYIFDLCVATDDAVFSFSWMKPEIQPFNFATSHAIEPYRLAAVCKSWRHIAFSNPGLWTRIVLDLSRDLARPPQVVELATAHLRRSGVLPLSFACYDQSQKHNGTEGQYVTPLYPIIDLIYSQSHRWRNVYIDLPEFFASLFHRLNISGDLAVPSPMLNSLTITIGDIYPVDSGLTSRHSPTHLRLQWELEDVHFNWIKVTDVDIKCISLVSFLYLFREAPLLQSLRISEVLVSDDDLAVQPTLTSITHLVLRNLSLAFTAISLANSNIIAAYLEKLNLPNLIYLEITINQQARVLSAIGSWGSPIEKLKLVVNQARFLDYTHLFEATSTVRELEIHHSALGIDATLDRLNSLTSTGFLPELRSLSCICSLEYNDRGDLVLPPIDWISIPSLFTSTNHRSEGPDAVVRPFRSLYIQVFVDSHDQGRLYLPNVKALVNVKERGFELKIVNVYGGKSQRKFYERDLIAESLAFTETS